jgi:hypothetical protein
MDHYIMSDDTFAGLRAWLATRRLTGEQYENATDRMIQYLENLSYSEAFTEMAHGWEHVYQVA